MLAVAAGGSGLLCWPHPSGVGLLIAVDAFITACVRGENECAAPGQAAVGRVMRSGR